MNKEILIDGIKYVFNSDTLEVYTGNNLNIKNKIESSIYPKKYDYINKLMLNMTEECNLKCCYCYEKMYNNRSSLNENLIDLVLNNIIAKREVIKIVFFGGEPLLKLKEIKYFLEKLKEINLKTLPKLAIITNGTILNEEIILLIKKYDIDITISIDGPEDIHDIQRPFIDGKGSFKTLYKNIKILQSHNIDISYECTLNEVRAKTHGYDKEKIKEFIEKDVKIKKGIIVPELNVDLNYPSYHCNIKNNPYIKAYLDKDIHSDLFEIVKRFIFRKPLKYPCGLGKTVINILANGDVIPCQLLMCESELIISNIRDFTLDKLQNNSWNNLYEKALIQNDCYNCWAKGLCQYCPARLMLETGRPVPSKKLCKSQKDTIEEFVKFMIKELINKG